MIQKSPGSPGKVRVAFSLPSSLWAESVHLVGDFNDWSPTATPLMLDDHCWNVSLELEAGEVYQFQYLVNNTDWVNEWQADYFCPGIAGADVSVVVARLKTPASHLETVTTPSRQRPSLRVIHGGKQEKQAI